MGENKTNSKKQIMRILGTEELLQQNKFIVVFTCLFYMWMYYKDRMWSGIAFCSLVAVVMVVTITILQKKGKIVPAVYFVCITEAIVMMMVGGNIIVTIPVMLGIISMSALYYRIKLTLIQILVVDVGMIMMIFGKSGFYGDMKILDVGKSFLGFNLCMVFIFFLVMWAKISMDKAKLEQNQAEEEQRKTREEKLRTEQLLKEVENAVAISEQQMEEELKTFAKIDKSTSVLSVSSEEMLDVAHLLNEKSEEQSATLEDMTQQTIDITERIKNTQIKMDASSKMAEISADKLGISAKNMKEIVEAINKIEGSSQKINGIIKDIEEIAYQTNLLALNAAIEAARAGEIGKGFAVVAEEVRVLANKSSISVNESKELVKISMENVEIGSKLVKQTAMDMNDVRIHSNETANSTKKVSENMAKQVGVMQEMLARMKDVSEGIVETAKVSAQSNGLADEVANQIVHINKSMVKR